MQTYSFKKIDLHADYPCPCCRRGRLSRITLTDALGCERCQEIFVLHEDGYVLEGLKTAYPYPKKWYWTGHQWTIQASSQGWFYLLPPIVRFTTIVGVFAMLAILVSVLLPLLPTLPQVWWAVIFGGTMLLCIVIWIAFQG